MALTLDIAADLERQILRQARRRGVDAKSFALALLRESLASAASQEGKSSESELLEEINRGFPADVWARYRELVAKRQAEDLEAEEHAELISLIDRIEVANAYRVECLAELANLRQVPLRALMAEMGIQPTTDG